MVKVEMLKVNQFVIKTDDAIYFQSYNKIICKKDIDGPMTLDEDYWNYSRTTSKYRCKFLGEGGEVTKRKIQDGIYQLDQLN